MERSGATWRSLEQNGGVWSSTGKFGASPEQCGGVQGDMERSGDAQSKCGERICVFFFNYKLEFCPEATKLLYKTSEIPE